jgi:hypothetical protein
LPIKTQLSIEHLHVLAIPSLDTIWNRLHLSTFPSLLLPPAGDMSFFLASWRKEKEGGGGKKKAHGSSCLSSQRLELLHELL